MINQTRKLSKTGSDSYYLVIPKEIVKELKWREKQNLIIKKVGKEIRIIDWKVKK